MKFLLAILAFGVFLALPITAQTGKVYIVQTNSAGDSVQLIDPVTDKIVAEIPGCGSDPRRCRGARRQPPLPQR